MNLNMFLTKCIKQSTALICIYVLILFNITALPAYSQDNDEYAVKTSMDMDKIIVPSDIGKVEDHYENLEDTLIVHIQDVHCHYEAQKNIAQILRTLVKRNKIYDLALEGAKGKFDTNAYHVFRNKSVNEKVADYFMMKGSITGAEYLAISSDLPLSIYGVEDKKTYLEHFSSFLEPIKFRTEYEQYYQAILASLKIIKDKIYPPKLKELDDKILAVEQNKIKLVDFSNYLKDILIANNIRLKNYKNFGRLVTLDHLEKGIDFDNVHKERTALLNAIAPRLNDEEIQDIRQVSLDYKSQKINDNDFYKYLKNLAQKKEVDISRFPNIAFYFKYLELYNQLDLNGLMKEKRELTKILKQKLFSSQDQQTIDRISSNLSLINQLFQLRVSNDEYTEYQSIKNSINSQLIANDIHTIAEKINVSVSLPAPFAFEEKFKLMDTFYALAKQRDKSLLNNTIGFMEDDDSNTAILISGGFHTMGMTEMMRDKDIGYVVISPNVTEEQDYDLYISNMREDEDLVEKMFTLPLPGEATIPPPLVTSISPFSPARKAIFNNSTAIYNIAIDLADRIRENIDLTGIEKLTPDDRFTVFDAFGGKEYLQKIAEKLGISALDIDLAGIRIEGANKGIITIPIKIYDIALTIAVTHPEYEQQAKSSPLKTELAKQSLSIKQIDPLHLTVYFTGIVTPDPELLNQDPFMNLLRTKLPVLGIPHIVPNIPEAIKSFSIGKNIPRIIPPMVKEDKSGNPSGRIKNYNEQGKSDSVFVFNAEGSAIVNLVQGLADPKSQGFEQIPGEQISVYTLSAYSPSQTVEAAFAQVTQPKSLGAILRDRQLPQSRIASIDRMADVSIAFDGNIDIPYPANERTLIEIDIPAPETLATNPEYNSSKIAQATINRITDSDDRVIVASFSAPDVFGATGDIVKTAKAIIAMDQQINLLVEQAQQEGMTILIAGTSGNAEEMIDDLGNPLVGHYMSRTTNPTPFIYIDRRDDRLKTNKDILQKNRSLGSIAPTILDVLGIDKPNEMSAPSIFKHFTPQQNDRILLITIDGFGISEKREGNAIEAARSLLKSKEKQLALDRIKTDNPHTTLNASGTHIGLRTDTAGYPRAGYFAIGTGLSEDDSQLEMVNIDTAIADGSFADNPVINKAINNALSNGSQLHLLGVISDVEIDASLIHLKKILQLAKSKGLTQKDVIIHAITDGTPVSVSENINRLIALTEKIGIGQVDTAGDRDWFMNAIGNTAKTKQAYSALVDNSPAKKRTKAAGVVLLPDQLLDDSLGLADALQIVRQQYGPSVKIGILTSDKQKIAQHKLELLNADDSIDFIISEQDFKPSEITAGLIDPVINRIVQQYPEINDVRKQVAIVTMDLTQLGEGASNKAQIFVQEQPKETNEVISASNALLLSSMALFGDIQQISAFTGAKEGKAHILKPIIVEDNFLQQLNRQRQAERMFETSA